MAEIPIGGGYKLPMDLCRRAAMKLDSFISDIHEIKEDEGLDSEDRQTLEQIAEISGNMLAVIVSMAAKEVSEEDFLPCGVSKKNQEKLYPDL